MGWRNTPDSYGLTAKSLHWLLAVLILGMLTLGFYMTGLGPNPDKFTWYNLHKSLGTLVLVFAALRLAWKFGNPKPEHLSTHAAWEVALARLTHGLLYVAMLAMPLSGWIMSSAGDFRYSFFGLFDMPHIVPKNETLFNIMVAAHGFIAYAIIALLSLHVAGALKHHFLDKDETLQRMSSRKVGFKAGAALTIVVGLVFALIGYFALFAPDGEETKPASASIVQQKAPVAPGGWIIDHANSAITFSVTQYGTPFEGKFENFDGAIVFDPARLENARAEINIDIASLKTGSAERDENAKGADWFDVSQFPQARFVSANFENQGGNQYVAHGTLQIRGQTQNVDLPFTLTIDGNDAKMNGTLTLDRQAFGVGQGQWAGADVIGKDVKVDIGVRAMRSDLQ